MLKLRILHTESLSLLVPILVSLFYCTVFCTTELLKRLFLMSHLLLQARRGHPVLILNKGSYTNNRVHGLKIGKKLKT